MTEHGTTVEFEDFVKVEVRTGTIIDAKLNPKTRVPAYELSIDFGALGLRKSSAQLTDNYTAIELIGKQIVAVVNFEPKRIAGVKSEVLVLGAVCEKAGVVLLEPTFPTENGMPIA